MRNTTLESLDLAKQLAQLCADKRGEKIKVLDVSEVMPSITDFFIIATGATGRQLRAMADYMQSELKKGGLLPLGIEGVEESTWILLDYGDAVVHLFLPDTRQYFNLEFLWSGAKSVPMELNMPARDEGEEALVPWTPETSDGTLDGADFDGDEEFDGDGPEDGDDFEDDDPSASSSDSALDAFYDDLEDQEDPEDSED